MDRQLPDGAVVTQRRIHLDPNRLRETGYLGIRRAAAFLSIGLGATERYLPESLALEKHSMWRFFPEPVPKDLAENAVAEFRPWITGNALRELDLHFSLFLDEANRVVRLTKLHRTRVRSDHVIKSISGSTNAAKKFRIVMRQLGEDEPDTSMLWSLSNARNCLSHAGGVVSTRHANADGKLLVKWIGLEARLVQNDTQIVLPPVFEPFQAPDPSQEADVVIAVVERQKIFEPGKKIQFTPNDLHEICFYYQRLVDQLLKRLLEQLRALGIRPEDADQTAN